MCKLCREDTYEICFQTHSRIRRGKRSQIFCDTVQEYTGEYPCTRCNTNYIMYCRRQHTIIDVDQYIVRVLSLKYLHPSIPIQKQNHLRYMASLKSQGKERNRSSAGGDTYKLIETNIEKRLYVSYDPTSNKIYTPRFVFLCRINGKRVSKSFNTLEEARQFKQEVLNGNYTNTTK